MDNSSLTRFDSQCHYFRDIRLEAHLYLFSETTEKIELKGIIGIIFAKMVAFFSESYKVKQRNSLQHKLIVFYSTRHEKVEESGSSIKLKAKKTLNRVTTFVKKKLNLAQTPAKTSPQTEVQDIINKYFPEGDPLTVKLKPRDCKADPTPEQKKDIALIITTLSTIPVTSLNSHKAALTEAGKRIKELHPLQFLTYVFSDATLTKNMKSLASEGSRWIVWKTFISGMSGTFDEEKNLNNVTDAQITNFAKIINVDSSLLISLAKENKWSEFVTDLIKKKQIS